MLGISATGRKINAFCLWSTEKRQVHSMQTLGWCHIKITRLWHTCFNFICLLPGLYHIISSPRIFSLQTLKNNLGAVTFCYEPQPLINWDRDNFLGFILSWNQMKWNRGVPKFPSDKPFIKFNFRVHGESDTFYSSYC